MERMTPYNCLYQCKSLKTARRSHHTTEGQDYTNGLWHHHYYIFYSTATLDSHWCLAGWWRKMCKLHMHILCIVCE